MANATKRGTKWLGRYRDPAGTERTKTFPTKREALAWGQEQEARLRSQTWTDPSRAKVTISQWSERWLETLTVKPSTRHSYVGLLNGIVLPRWGHLRLDQVTTADVRTWVATMKGKSGKPLSPARVRHAHHVLNAILELAVEDGRLPKNPATPSGRGFMPKLVKKNGHHYLTHAQVHALADAAGEFRPLILLLAYTGLRWGEATALRVRDVDLLAGRVHVQRSAIDTAGELTYGTPKSHATRTVVMPAFMRQQLDGLLLGKGPDDLVFTAPNGGALRNQNFRKRVFDPAAKAAGLTGLTPHHLRHTAASLAISAGANVKAVQKMLGHSSAAMTLDTYADLFDTDLESVADRLDTAVSGLGADSLRTPGDTPTVETAPAVALFPLAERQHA